MATEKLNISLSELKLDNLAKDVGKSQFSSEVINQRLAGLTSVAGKLADPILLYEICPVNVKDGRLLFYAGDEIFSLDINDNLSELTHAREVVVGLITLGSAIEEEIQKYNSKNQLLASYLLSEISISMMGQLIAKTKKMIMDLARQRDCFVSLVHIPGSTPGLSLSIQPLILSVLKGENKGIAVNQHMIIEPFYSVSFLVGIGTAYNNHYLYPKCPGCSRAKSCAWRNL